jgi:hypothetical protein
LLFIAFIGFDRLGDRPNGQLCRQTKTLADLIVELLLELKLRGTALLVGVLGNLGTGRIEGMHGVKQRGVLLWRQQEFYLQCCFHCDKASRQERQAYHFLSGL